MKKISGPDENGLSTYEWADGLSITMKDLDLYKEHYEELFSKNKSLRSNDNILNSIDVIHKKYPNTCGYDKT